MIQAVMHQPSASFSWLSAQYPDPDLAQTILVKWGNLVPWAWSVWDDQRFAGLEYITDLVSCCSHRLYLHEAERTREDYYMALSYTSACFLGGHMSWDYQSI
jgi:hypothetical protein